MRVWEQVLAELHQLGEQVGQSAEHDLAQAKAVISDALAEALRQRMPEIEAAMGRVAEKAVADLVKGLQVSAASAGKTARANAR